VPLVSRRFGYRDDDVGRLLRRVVLRRRNVGIAGRRCLLDLIADLREDVVEARDAIVRFEVVVVRVERLLCEHVVRNGLLDLLLLVGRSHDG